MRTIPLTSRYNRKGDKRLLVEQKNGWWVFEGDEFTGSMIRFGQDPKTNIIEFFDPEGGPFIEVGTILKVDDNSRIKVLKITSNSKGLRIKGESV